MIIRHGWVGDHHALHWSCLLAAHHALTLRWLLHPQEALEPLLTRQDWLVTCEEETSFELVVPGRTKMKLHGVRELLHQPTWRPFTVRVRNAYFLTMHVMLLKSGWGHDSKKFIAISTQGYILPDTKMGTSIDAGWLLQITPFRSVFCFGFNDTWTSHKLSSFSLLNWLTFLPSDFPALPHFTERSAYSLLTWDTFYFPCTRRVATRPNSIFTDSDKGNNHRYVTLYCVPLLAPRERSGKILP